MAEVMLHGLVKVDLSGFWKGQYESPQLNPESYAEYANMRKYLKDIGHQFGWYNSGVYLPDYVLLEPDAATLFKLKYTT